MQHHFGVLQKVYAGILKIFIFRQFWDGRNTIFAQNGQNQTLTPEFYFSKYNLANQPRRLWRFRYFSILFETKKEFLRTQLWRIQCNFKTRLWRNSPFSPKIKHCKCCRSSHFRHLMRKLVIFSIKGEIAYFTVINIHGD